jgi:predicted RNase H-like HicB family nuclease
VWRDSAACAHVNVAVGNNSSVLVGRFDARSARGRHTQGRTVDKARRRIVEAMDLFVADAPRARIVDDVKLPRGAANAPRTHATLRKGADEEDRRAA